MRILKLLIGWPISIASLFFILRILFERFEAIPKIQELNIPVLIAAAICFFTYTALRALVWQEILKAKKYKLSFKNSLRLWAFSEFKRYTPGNIWSLLGRVLSFETLGVKKEDSAKALLYEAELIILGGILVSLFSLPIVFNIIPNTKFEFIAQPLLIILVTLLFLIFVFAKSLKVKIFPNFNYKANLKLTSLSSLSLVFFGIGSYLTFSSVFYLDPRNFILLSSFSVFALLIGYLSLVTPMGLGVREGVLLLGLSYFLTGPQAAISTIFARLWFIISELVFLSIIWLWNESKNKLLLKIEYLIAKNIHLSILILFVLVYVIYFTNTTFLRHDNFFTGRFDLGNMDQTVWNTVNGRIFELTDPNGTSIISRLSFHADFMLVLLSPLYVLWKDPKMLLFAQSLILPIGAIFVYLISRKVIKDKNFSLILGFSYLINPAINHSNLFDFHSVVLATTFLLAAFYFLINKQYILLSIFLILAGLTKEQVWVISALFGIYLFIISRKKLLGSAIFFISVFLFCFLVFIAIPKVSGEMHFALSYYSDFGDSPFNILKKVLIDPVKTLTTIFGKEQIDYLVRLLAPFGFFPLLSPLMIFALPDLFINLLSNNSQLHQIVYQYTATITPFLFISTIYSIRMVKKFTPNLNFSFYAFVILLFSLYSAYDFGPLPGAKNPNLEMYNNNLENKKFINNFLSKIPKDYSVASTNNLGAHLSHRQKIYTVPMGVKKADIIVFLIKNPKSNFAAKQEQALLFQIEKNENFIKIAEDQQFIAFKRKGLNFSL